MGAFIVLPLESVMHECLGVKQSHLRKRLLPEVSDHGHHIVGRLKVLCTRFDATRRAGVIEAKHCSPSQLPKVCTGPSTVWSHMPGGLVGAQISDTLLVSEKTINTGGYFSCLMRP